MALVALVAMQEEEGREGGRKEGSTVAAMGKELGRNHYYEKGLW